jgi:predicted dehydrogenase
LFFDLGSHCFDLLDFLIGAVGDPHGIAVNTAGAGAVEDVTAAAFRCASGVAGTAIFNFNAASKTDAMTIIGTRGTIVTPVFADADVIVDTERGAETLPVRNPPHVHQPLIQTIVDELHGRGRCASTGESAARASWVLDRCLGRPTSLSRR